MHAKRRRKFDAVTLAAIEIEHAAGELTLDAIGEKYDCTGSYICKLAKEEGWPPRRPQPKVSAPPRPRRRRDPRVTMRKRMCKVINGKLKEMEDGMKSGAMTAAAVERNAKLVTSMIGGLQKVPDPEEDKQRTSKSGGSIDEVERLQREIIERFERIQRRRQAEGGSG
jgi:hypothetical protein